MPRTKSIAPTPKARTRRGEDLFIAGADQARAWLILFGAPTLRASDDNQRDRYRARD